MASLLSSAQATTSLTPGWAVGADVPGVTLRSSSPNTSRDGSVVNDLDQSFGSSMSISSLDSPRRGSRRTQVPIHLTTVDTQSTLDPFSSTVCNDTRLSIPSTSMLMPTPHTNLAMPESSPHAMDISSPAAMVESSDTQSFSIPYPSMMQHSQSLQRQQQQQGIPTLAPILSAAPSSSLRRADRSMRKSMPVLGQFGSMLTYSSSPESPEQKQRPKKRLASTRQLQDASFETDGPDRCVFFSEETITQSQPMNRARTHTRTQSVCISCYTAPCFPSLSNILRRNQCGGRQPPPTSKCQRPGQCRLHAQSRPLVITLAQPIAVEVIRFSSRHNQTREKQNQHRLWRATSSIRSHRM